MNDFERPPRTHGAMTLSEAADWLSSMTGHRWTAGAVLGRMHEWERAGVSADRLPLESVRVVLPRGAVLVDPGTGETLPPSSRAEVYYVAGVERFVADLHETGEALPLALVGGVGGGRWRITEPVRVDAVRLSSDEVAVLLPAFERLAQGFSDELAESAKLWPTERRHAREDAPAGAREAAASLGAPDESEANGVPSVRRHSTKLPRRDALAPIIDRLLRDAEDPADHAALWNYLLALADRADRPDPLFGVSDGEVRYRGDNGDVRFLKRKNLIDRLRRRAK